MSAVKTRGRRRIERQHLQSSQIFAIAEDPALVLGYLPAVDMARISLTCAGCRRLVNDSKVLKRIAEGNWLSAIHPARDLEDLVALDKLRSELDTWRVIRLKRKDGGQYVVVERFEGDGTTGESALLCHAEGDVALELVGASNGWFRWSRAGIDGVTPFTGTPPTWMDRHQDWDADWHHHADGSEVLAEPLRRGDISGVLPGNWALSVVDGGLSVRNGNVRPGRVPLPFSLVPWPVTPECPPQVWIHLTEDGFRTAQKSTARGGDHQDSYNARYMIAYDDDDTSRAVEVELPRDARGPWSTPAAPAVDQPLRDLFPGELIIAV